MGKHGDVTFRKETRHGDTKRLQLVLAGTVCLFMCSLLLNVLVYVHLTAAITDLSRRLGDVEDRPDSLRSSVDPNGIAANDPDVETTAGQGNIQDTTNNQSLTHFAGRPRQSGPVRKRNARSICHPWYECHNGVCIPPRWLCDFNKDCTDGSDEYPLNEECDPPYWCKNGKQIPSKWQCDGDNDCHDGSDEYPLNEECKIDPCETHQCQNNATCRTTEEGYTCICTEGWRGEYCQQKIGPCETHQCQNNATCRANKDGYKCSCTEGWRGKHCQRKRVLKEQRGMRQEKNYGLGSLLSVHIQARTDTTESSGAIQVTGDFTQWEDITETRFCLQNGQLEIKEPGKYFIYSQVFFDKDEKDEKARYSIKKGGEVKLTCETPLTGVPPPLTCYTAGVLDLQRGDILVLYVYGKDSWIVTAEDATFWGAIKLSIGLPKEDRPRKRRPKGKS